MALLGVALALDWRSDGAQVVLHRLVSDLEHYHVALQILQWHPSEICSRSNFDLVVLQLRSWKVNKTVVRPVVIIVSLNWICFHSYEIVVTGCTESCHFDNFRCRQWWKFCQNDILVSVNVFISSYYYEITDISRLITSLCPFQMNQLNMLYGIIEGTLQH